MDHLKRLEEWAETCSDVIAHHRFLTDTCGLSPDAPTIVIIDELLTAYTAAVSQLVGDDAQWLDWFLNENKLGAKGFAASAGPGQPEIPVHSVADLLQIIA